MLNKNDKSRKQIFRLVQHWKCSCDKKLVRIERILPCSEKNIDGKVNFKISSL